MIPHYEGEIIMKYALVTGTDHGVGFELTKALLKRGYFVVACRHDEKEKHIEEIASENPGRMLLLTLEINDAESVEKMKKEVEKAVPHIDLLINDAGVLGDMEKIIGEELNFEEIQHVIDVNAVGTLRVTNALYPLVTKSEDKTIVNISSEAGSITDCWREGWFGYCLSKSANNMLSALVHNNLRKLGGKVIAIHPGHVATYMRGHLDTTAKIGPEESARGILNVILDMNLPVEDRPQFRNYLGESLPW